MDDFGFYDLEPDDDLGFDLESHAEWLRETDYEDAAHESPGFGGPLAGLPTEADAEQATPESNPRRAAHVAVCDTAWSAVQHGSPRVKAQAAELFTSAGHGQKSTAELRLITARLLTLATRAPHAQARSSLSSGRPRARAARRQGDSGDDPPTEPDPPEHDGVGRPDGALIRFAASRPKEAAMRRHRPPRRHRADHRPLRPIEPPMLVALLLEVNGSCWACDAPVERTPSGRCSVDHRPGCQLAADVGRAV